MKDLYKDATTFDLDVVTSGTFMDMDYEIITTVIRLSPAALNEYILMEIRKDETDFETRMEFQDYLEQQKMARQAFDRKIFDLLGCDPKGRKFGFHVSQTLSEIFTVVYMVKQEENFSGRLPNAEPEL